MKHAHHIRPKLQKLSAYAKIVGVLSFGVMGSILMFRSFAAGQWMTLQPESGTLAGNIQIAADPTASANSFVRFGVPAPPPLPLSGHASPVYSNGQLSVCGTQLCNHNGQPIQLRGMSTHGIQWYGLGSCINASSLTALRNDWGADILRVSLYVQEDGYENNPTGFTAQAQTIVDMLIERDMYALIDWHMLTPGDPMYNLERAKTYFTAMANKYKDTPNVIYEIANEPSGVSWSEIKAYANQIIPVIRAIDPNGIIIIGTPGWTSLGVSDGSAPSEIWNNPVAGQNIMYSFHFYAASHLQPYLNTLDEASDRLPIFVTEWGSQEYTGDGPNDFASAQSYIDLMASKKISWTSWNYSDDFRSGAAFNPGTCPGGPWSGSSLKPAGQWVKDKILTPGDAF